MTFNTGETSETLRQTYNPDGSTLRKAQLRMLDMLLFLDKICKENDIQYFLSDGNLLGAVRHGGFIPWDDDMDIIIMEKDAKRLKKILLTQYKDTPYVLQCHQTDHNYKQFWYVLRDRYSEYIQDSQIHKARIYKGLQVDIFIYSDKIIPILKKISYQIVKLSNKMIEKQHLKAAEFLFAINNLLVIPIFKFISLFKINKNDISHTYTAQWYTSFKKDEIFPLGTIQFEGHTIPAPRNTTYYLETLFGANYMDLPSIEKRDAHKANILFYK